jgi:hypothetical protein
LADILEVYERASGQLLNREKTSIFFSRNTCEEVKEVILRIAGIPATQRYDKYLGLPALVGKSRIREFQSIKERVSKRVNDWKTKFLSQAGKEILLKAVVQAIPTYSMSIFCFLKNFVRRSILSCKGFGGDIRRMRIKSIGCRGKNWGDQKHKEVWVFETSLVLIKPFSLSKDGGSFNIRTAWYPKFLRRSIIQTIIFWRLKLVTDHHWHGGVFSLQLAYLKKD